MSLFRIVALLVVVFLLTSVAWDSPARAQTPPDDGMQEIQGNRGGVPFTSRVIRVERDPATGYDVRAGSIIVKFRPGTSATSRADAHRAASATAVEDLLTAADSQRVQVPPADAAAMLARYQARADVEYAVRDR